MNLELCVNIFLSIQLPIFDHCLLHYQPPGTYAGSLFCCHNTLEIKSLTRACSSAASKHPMHNSEQATLYWQHQLPPLAWEGTSGAPVARRTSVKFCSHHGNHVREHYLRQQDLNAGGRYCKNIYSQQNSTYNSLHPHKAILFGNTSQEWEGNS